MYKSVTTIADIYHLALPGGTELLAGAEVLNRPVSWACSLRPSPPAFPKLEGNELALIDLEDLRRLDARMALERVVRNLQSARISAIAVLGEVTEAAIRAAGASGIALFQLPTDLPLVQVERAVIRLIVDRAGYIAQRSADLQHDLNQIALDGGGLDKIARHIAQFAQQPFLLLREDGQVAAAAGLEHLPESRRQSLFGSLPNITTLRSWVATQSVVGNGKKATGVLPLNINSDSLGYSQAVLTPIVAAESVRGYCLVLRPLSNAGQDVSAVEEIAVGQAVAAAALEWAKQNAVGLAEERMRAAFVDELLASEVADEQAWIQRGGSLNYDLTKPHVAWMVEAAGIPDWPAPLLKFLQEQGVNAPLSRREEGVLLYWPTSNPKSGRDLKTVALAFAERLQTHYPKAYLMIGISRPATSPSTWLQSQQQARESLRLGKEWKGSPVTYFGDLGLYQLLTTLGNNPEAARFFRRTLGRLISHDDAKHAELVETLEAFFACHGNLSQTAHRLHIHRNTLTYRLEQISQITQLNLDDPDARFSLQFALKLRPVMKYP
jgi:PucR family transcriptional regulator, purine catabolism regulatory protein